MFFFFQAEDGIRDLVRSRGLGDVYKRQSFTSANMDAVDIPTGVSIFPKEIFRASRRWAEKRFSKLIYWNELERGGHFAAFEQPAIFVQELRNCFRLLR